MPKSAFFASAHPCYDLINGGYTCDCGYRSAGIEEHNKHVVSSHNTEYAKQVMSGKDWDNYYEIINYCQCGQAGIPT